MEKKNRRSEFAMRQSPMFKHAVESFQHGLEHHLDGSERSRKFALLHIDQAVELMLKEKIVQLGKSIYKTDGSTLSLHESFRSLKDMSLPEQPRLEELHDLRNTVQHKGLTPDAESTKFYIETAYFFIKRFLQEELGVRFGAIIPDNCRIPMEGPKIRDVNGVLSLLQLAKDMADPAEKILTTYTALERAIDSIAEPSDAPISFRGTFRQIMEGKGESPEKIKPYLGKILSLRSQVVHSDYVPSPEEADSYYGAAWGLLRRVGIAKQFGKKSRAKRAEKDEQSGMQGRS